MKHSIFMSLLRYTLPVFVMLGLPACKDSDSSDPVHGQVLEPDGTDAEGASDL